jgi:hypothetical protein
VIDQLLSTSAKESLCHNLCNESSYIGNQSRKSTWLGFAGTAVKVGADPRKLPVIRISQQPLPFLTWVSLLFTKGGT